jgi:hypothetical protein
VVPWALLLLLALVACCMKWDSTFKFKYAGGFLECRLTSCTPDSISK